jgi:hypothetical protein
MAPGLSTNGNVGTDQLITDEQAKTIGRMWATENPQMMAFVRTGAIAYELIESLTPMLGCSKPQSNTRTRRRSSRVRNCAR